MKLKIQYDSRERKYITSNTYNHIYRNTTLKPVRIFRTPCGMAGAALKRYFYHGEFIAPSDAEFTYNGHIRAHINRKANKHFRPKLLTFEDNVWHK